MGFQLGCSARTRGRGCVAGRASTVHVPVGFEPTPFRTGTLIPRLRPLGHRVPRATFVACDRASKAGDHDGSRRRSWTHTRLNIRKVAINFKSTTPIPVPSQMLRVIIPAPRSPPPAISPAATESRARVTGRDSPKTLCGAKDPVPPSLFRGRPTWARARDAATTLFRTADDGRGATRARARDSDATSRARSTRVPRSGARRDTATRARDDATTRGSAI